MSSFHEHEDDPNYCEDPTVESYIEYKSGSICNGACFGMQRPTHLPVTYREIDLHLPKLQRAVQITVQLDKHEWTWVDRSCCFFSPVHRFRKFCVAIVTNRQFDKSIYALILISSLVLAA